MVFVPRVQHRQPSSLMVPSWAIAVLVQSWRGCLWRSRSTKNLAILRIVGGHDGGRDFVVLTSTAGGFRFNDHFRPSHPRSANRSSYTNNRRLSRLCPFRLRLARRVDDTKAYIKLGLISRRFWLGRDSPVGAISAYRRQAMLDFGQARRESGVTRRLLRIRYLGWSLRPTDVRHARLVHFSPVQVWSRYMGAPGDSTGGLALPLPKRQDAKTPPEERHQKTCQRDEEDTEATNEVEEDAETTDEDKPETKANNNTAQERLRDVPPSNTKARRADKNKRTPESTAVRPKGAQDDV
ncbi:uncharacterized protein STEHIDRAFT_114667 [Stereum hirsutum FP-91666 SS1]|uniref:uncharacterized protein n=1 Tax=Stereum hirsutum (strain FP-91666) TaxID=721885 RepID=UPI0004449BDC|nr:uncharacterized protein STEHIDRAFT_114667 [Stereum hirsutum FP-91666 SS1]EIM81992.1 hypothetical protein STEHIDRAFT_114667 [Stereum hirsutum FP-91666 SS1]